MCHTAAPETRQHFLAECSAYAPERETYIEKLRNNPVLSKEIKSDLRNQELLTQLTLDASFYVNTKYIDVLELYSRELNPGRFGPGSFRPGSFQSNFGVGRFGLGRWVDSALGRFGPGSFRPKSIPKCRLLRTDRQTNR